MRFIVSNRRILQSILQHVCFRFTALGIGSADIVSGMIEDEKRHSEQYLEKLKEMMQAKGVRPKKKLLVDLRDFFFRFRFGGTKKINKKL